MSTIVSISTAPGIGGIGIIRMSGEKSFEIICWRESTMGKLLECRNLKTR